MYENEVKGSFGAFSSIGRITAETFINIRKKDKILNPKKNTGNKEIIINFLKRNKYQNIEGDLKEEEVKEPNEKNLDDSEIEDVEEESDIFQINEEEEKKKKENSKKNKKELFSCYHRTNEDAYKFHDMHVNKKKEKSTFSTPNCTKYFPSKDFVWHRMPTCPKWETMESRKPLSKKIYDGRYLGHDDPLKNINKCFINMDKQTMRGDIINCNNVRINTAKPFISKNKKNSSVREFDKILNESTNSSKNNYNRVKSGKDYNRKRNLEMNNKWKAKTNYHDIVPIKTFSHFENQKENNLINEKEKEKESKEQINNIKVLTTELTDSANNLNINTNITNNTNNNKSYISNKKENKSQFEEDKNEINTENIDNESSESNDSYHKYKNHYTKQLKSHQKKDNLPKLTEENSNRSSMIINNNSTSLKSKISEKRPKTTRVNHRKIIKGPEFDKIIPREYYDNLADNGLTLIPFSINNYTQVRERPLSVVVYKRKPIFKKKINNFKGMEIDQYKNICNFINHKCYVPIFNKMKTRPMDDGTPLPVFMKGVVSRDGCNTTTDTSLKMNYFADGKIRGNYNTFLPKKSYNKIVNLNLMNSNALIDYLLVNKKDSFQNNEIMKSLKFYNKNFNDLLKETSSGKFDNITYKTIKNKYEIDEKYLKFA